jgi:translocation and assembly module TamA
MVIDPGKKVRFHTTEIKAFPGIKTGFIRDCLLWEEGEIFDAQKLMHTADDFRNSQIFSTVKIEPMPDKMIADKIPILVELSEDKKHSVNCSLLYSGMMSMNFERRSSTQKKLKSIIARISWARLNAFGSGEKLNVVVEGSPLRSQRADYCFETSISQPNVFLKNNAAKYIFARRQELTNAYFKKSNKLSLMFTYPINYYLTCSTGLAAEKIYVTADDELNELRIPSPEPNKNYEDFLLPVEIAYDKRNNFLDPTSGYRIGVKFSYIHLRKAVAHSLQMLNLCYSNNFPFDDSKQTIFALNIEWRTIVGGNKIQDIPLDKRIYAGGMGSVRGYGNQLATEIITGQNTPMGGKSSIEFNAEIRRKITTDFGGVVFLDGAKIFRNDPENPDFPLEKKRWFFSVGFGIRYFTEIGPVRLDFAFPIRRRKGIDSKMQFIINLGQAF